MNKTKYLEYYMDSKLYSKDEVQKSIDETKKEFPNKQIDVQVHLNKFGVYIITFTIKNKKSLIRNIFIKLKFKNKENLLLAESENKHKKPKEDTNNNINQIINKEETHYSENKEKTKQSKVQKRFEKYNNKVYGQYKPTHTYRPY